MHHAFRPQLECCIFLASFLNVAASLLNSGSPEVTSLLSIRTRLGTRPSFTSALRSQVAAREQGASTCSFDHSRWDDVLHKFVKGPQMKEDVMSTLFDYDGLLASDSALSKFHKYVTSLDSATPSCLTSDGKLAFWANAYNALIINLVLSDAQARGKLPKSIKELAGDATSVWNRRAGSVAGKAMTLEQVLTEARNLGDPRIHAAVNCASLSCPDLRRNAYKGENMQAQLEEQVKNWLSNPTKGAKMESNRLLVSHIFEWHAEDFSSLESFLAGPLGFSSSVKVAGYLPYNWDLSAK